MEHVTALTFGGQRRLSTLLSLQSLAPPFTIGYKPKHSHARTDPAPPPCFEGGQYFGQLHNYSGGNAMQWTGQDRDTRSLVWFASLNCFFFSSCFSRLPLPGGNKIGFHFRPGPAVFLCLRLRNTATAGNYFERNALRRTFFSFFFFFIVVVGPIHCKKSPPAVKHY